jgi:transcriptional regulator with XRE-family HTH domain
MGAHERDAVLPLRVWRLRRGLSQRELAERAALTRRQVVRLEGRQTRGWPQTWRKLAHALGVEPEQIAEYRATIGLASPDDSDSAGATPQA